MERHFGFDRQLNSSIDITVPPLDPGNGITVAIKHYTSSQPFPYCPCHQVTYWYNSVAVWQKHGIQHITLLVKICA